MSKCVQNKVRNVHIVNETFKELSVISSIKLMKGMTMTSLRRQPQCVHFRRPSRRSSVNEAEKYDKFSLVGKVLIDGSRDNCKWFSCISHLRFSVYLTA